MNDIPQIGTVYPRVCGGTLVERVGEVDCRGSIPACAGEPQRRKAWLPNRPVYPRVCGGTRWIARTLIPPIGLSPRVRGNLVSVESATNSKGSIPACAGEPAVYCLPGRHPRVYPRVCGGTALNRGDTERWSGLSPRVRGNLPAADRHSHCRGSIPACAGEPGQAPPSSAGNHRSVYPRVCGGTEPLIRRDHRLRSIPACAGEPRSCCRQPQSGPVYPRVCGGTTFPLVPTWSIPGLSPRVRGNHYSRRLA